jgi:hypothetical protein
MSPTRERHRAGRIALTALACLAACTPDPTHLGDLPEGAILCGRDDAVAAAGICFESSAREFAVAIEPLHFITGNFSSDSAIDVIPVGRRDGAIGAELWLGSDRGPLGPPRDPMLTGCSAFPVAGPLLVSGYDDVLFATCEAFVNVYPGGDAGFGPPIRIDLPVVLRSTVIDDIEGDGDIDLIALGEDTSGIAALSVVLRQADGSLGVPSLQPLSTLSFDPSGATRADFDGDGLIDLAIRRGDVAGSLGYVLGQSPGVFGEPQRLTTELRPWTLAAADLDGDGDDDLVYGDDEARQVCTWIVDALPDPQPVCRALDGIVPTNLTAADLDGDGIAEVVIGDATDTSVWVWRVDLAGEADVMEPLAVPAGTELVDLVDFDADGTLDLIAGHFAAKTFSIRFAVP